MNTSLARLTFVALLACPVFVACAATTDDIDDDVEVAEQDQTASVDVSTEYVGRYAPLANVPAGDIASLVLRADRSFALVRKDGVAEAGSFVARKNARETRLYLTIVGARNRSYRIAIGSGARPALTMTRYSQTSVLERRETSCEAFACAIGHACEVSEDDGVPAPTCIAVEPAWKIRLARHDLWSAALPDTFHAASRTLYCHVSPEGETVQCGPASYDLRIAAKIQHDGSFTESRGTPHTSGGALSGKIDADGTLTLHHFRSTTCFRTSSSWCETIETLSTKLPKTSPLVETCYVPGQTFPSGGWVAGYHVACTECQGRCVGGR